MKTLITLFSILSLSLALSSSPAFAKCDDCKGGEGSKCKDCDKKKTDKKKGGKKKPATTEAPAEPAKH